MYYIKYIVCLHVVQHYLHIIHSIIYIIYLIHIYVYTYISIFSSPPFSPPPFSPLSAQKYPLNNPSSGALG